MVLIAFSLLFPLSDLNAARGWSAFRWAVSALAMGYMCPWLWNLRRAIAGYQVRLDGRDVDFNLGTKKKHFKSVSNLGPDSRDQAQTCRHRSTVLRSGY
jgi:hypothetical protein